PHTPPSAHQARDGGVGFAGDRGGAPVSRQASSSPSPTVRAIWAARRPMSSKTSGGAPAKMPCGSSYSETISGVSSESSARIESMGSTMSTACGPSTGVVDSSKSGVTYRSMVLPPSVSFFLLLSEDGLSLPGLVLAEVLVWIDLTLPVDIASAPSWLGPQPRQ